VNIDTVISSVVAQKMGYDVNVVTSGGKLFTHKWQQHRRHNCEIMVDEKQTLD